MTDKAHIVVISQNDTQYRAECREDTCQWVSRPVNSAELCFRFAVYHQYKRRGVNFRRV